MVVVGMTGCRSGAAEPTPAPTWTPQVLPLEIDGFHTSGYVPQPIPQLPYTGRGEDVVDVTSADHPVDANGIALYNDANGEWVDTHPVVQEQYALSALDEFHITGNTLWLERAVANARHLIDNSVDRDGAMWFPYPFPWTYYERTLTPPWYSGMAQGTALSLFVRLAEEQPDVQEWRTAADATWKSFLQPFSTVEPWSSLVDDSHLWFEEYAGNQPPLLVLNGHIFALYGVYEYAVMTQDPMAVLFFDGGATTVLETMPMFRVPGGISYYCAQKVYCQVPGWQNPGYQGIHVYELVMVGQMTGDPAFQTWADLLTADGEAAAAATPDPSAEG